MSQEPTVTILPSDPRLSTWPYAPDTTRWSPHTLFAGMPPMDPETWCQVGFNKKPEWEADGEKKRKCQHFFIRQRDGSYKCRHCGERTTSSGRRQGVKV